MSRKHIEIGMRPGLTSADYAGIPDRDYTLDIYVYVDQDKKVADLIFTSSMGEYSIADIPRDEMLRLAKFLETTARQEMDPRKGE